MKRWFTITRRQRRHKIIRKKIAGTKDKPRLSVYRGIKNIHIQLIDDFDGRTLLALSTNSPAIRDSVKKDGGNVKGATVLGAALAEACKAKGIKQIVFDRSGYLYHGRVRALADAARKGGLEF